MKEILVINTGGTFNKRYNPVHGTLEVLNDGSIPVSILKKWHCKLEVLNIIGKDSLDMNSEDRLFLLATLTQSDYTDIIIIHGTDTMNVTAEYLADAELDKRIVLTGAMVPYSIDPVEATANLASAYGYLQLLKENGVYIAMNGIIDTFENVEKDRKNGKFVLTK